MDETGGFAQTPAMPFSPAYRPATAHADLGDAFYDVVAAADFPEHILRHRNQREAAQVGLEGLTDAEWVGHFGRFVPLPGSLPQPLSLRYHGHQFRHYNPDLGDGRGFLFAQLYDNSGRLLDLGTKGSGTTPWSRGGDGRLTLKGGVREVLATEMLQALGVNTSKSFSLIETGESLYRGDEPSPTRAAVLVRLSHSHIRIGSFQRLAYLRQTDNLQRLMDHTIRLHMPGCWRDDLAERAVAFLAEVTLRVARTGGQWMAAGFVHGVLNTDNINVTGESFDYGPWRFLPSYEPGFTAAYFDNSGLYAFGRQPQTLLWNLGQLGGCLLAFAEKEALQDAMDPFGATLQAAFAAALLRRLCLRSRGAEADTALGSAVYQFLFETKAPYDQFFFDLAGGLDAARIGRSPAAVLYQAPSFAPLQAAFAGYEPTEGAAHPYFAGTPCSMLIEEVEAIWAPIAERDDWSAFHAKLAAISEMSAALAL
jgi:uncharacterized protein YdiU (UPF0061 family)